MIKGNTSCSGSTLQGLPSDLAHLNYHNNIYFMFYLKTTLFSILDIYISESEFSPLYLYHWMLFDVLCQSFKI